MNNWKQKLKMRLLAILLLAVTLLFWGFYDRYEAVGPVLLESPSLSEAFRVRGESSEANSVFTLNVSDPKTRAEVRFVLPDAVDYKFIRLTGRIRTENVVVGKYPWNSGRLLLIQRDKKNKWIPCDHGLHAETGTVDWQEQVFEFEIMPEAASAEVVLQQSGKSGLAQFDSILAVPVRLKRSFIWFRVIFAITWVVVAVIYFRRCRLDRRRLKVLILLNAVVIIAGTLMPGEWIESSVDRVKEKVEKAVFKPEAAKEAPVKPAGKSAPKPERSEQFKEVVSRTHQIGHFALFASLCFLVYLSAALERQHSVYFTKVAFDLLIFAAITESLQHLTMDRTPGFSDWLIDACGMATAFMLFLLIQLTWRRRRVKESFGV